MEQRHASGVTLRHVSVRCVLGEVPVDYVDCKGLIVESQVWSAWAIIYSELHQIAYYVYIYIYIHYHKSPLCVDGQNSTQKSAEILPGRSLWHDIPAGLVQDVVANELFPSPAFIARASMKATWTCENAWQRLVASGRWAYSKSEEVTLSNVGRRWMSCDSQEFLGW